MPCLACPQLRDQLVKKGYKAKDVKKMNRKALLQLANGVGVPLADADKSYTSDELLSGVAEPATNGLVATSSRECMRAWTVQPWACHAGAHAHMCACMHARRRGVGRGGRDHPCTGVMHGWHAPRVGRYPWLTT